MKKKLIKHIVDIMTENPIYTYQFTDGTRYFALDTHRIIEYGECINDYRGLNVQANAHDYRTINACKTWMQCDESKKYDYHMIELPKAEIIRENIRNLVGRKLTDVYWSNGEIVINARWLLKAMEALDATVGYISSTNTASMPIMLYHEDNLQSDVKELILPLNILKSHPEFFVRESQFN